MTDAQRTRRGAPPARPATIYDVARASGVSHQTVSRLLKGADNIAPERRLRVEKALRELNYRPNEAARVLATNQGRRIAAFTGHLDEVAPQLILEGAGEVARREGYILEITSIGWGDARAHKEVLDSILRAPLAGVLLAASADELLAALRPEDIHVPVVVEVEASLDADPTRQHPFALGVRHLLECGHRSFYFVGGPTNWASARTRRAVFLDLLADAGAVCRGEVAGNWLPGAGEASVEAIVESGVTAVACANDRMALGVLAGLRRRGVDVPGAVSVTGYDGLEDGAYYSPGLTTVEVDYRGMGAAVMDRLLAEVGARSRVGLEPAAPRLILRESTSRI